MPEKDMPKYDDITPRYPGDYRVKEIVLYSYGGSQLDITGLTALINIYQDLDTPFISGNIMFYDTIGAANKLSWKVSESAEDSSPMIPGRSLIIESQRTAAGSSPPETT